MMKCPKCGYLGFETGDRCKNCGYDFSLALEEMPPSHLAIRSSDPIGPLADLDLQKPSPRRTPRSGADATAEGEPVKRRSSQDESELPLFNKGDDADRPLVTASAPRPPLAVRRSTPHAAKVRPRPPRHQAVEAAFGFTPSSVEPAPEAVASTMSAEPASAPARIFGALVDIALLALIDLGIVYLTLRIARLRIDEVGILPRAPLLGFLVCLNGGYLVAFTAAIGQTIGKMAAGARVVGLAKERIEFGRAVLRTVGYLVSALPLGLGFLPGLIGPTRRTLHDRLAETRVIRVAAK
jgi:uncharacterized RDD family membrane protein YckC